MILSRFKSRYIIIFLCFFAAFTCYVERVGFSIAYTRMAKTAGIEEGIKGTVLSAFYWGYAISQIPGGALAHRIGGRPLLLFAFIAWSIVVFFIPTDAKYTSWMIGARVSIGLFQGLVIPSVHTVLSQWVPPKERAMAASLTTSGMYLGSAAAMWILPTIAEIFGPETLLPSVGLLGTIWTVSWYFLGAKSPPTDQELPTLTNNDGKHRRRPPWSELLSSMAVWSIVINNFTFHYAVYVVMNWLPTYLTDLLHAELSSVGTVKSLPYFLMFASSNAGGWLGDYLIMKWGMSVASGRRIVNTLGFFVSAMTLLCMARARSLSEGVLWTTLVMSSLGFSRGGFSVNHMDIAPRFAGIVMGISNTAGTLSGVVGVAITGWILEINGGGGIHDGWIEAFSISALLCVMGSILFLRASRGEKLFD